MRSVQVKLALYVTLLPLGFLVQYLVGAGIGPLSWAGLALIVPALIGLAALAGWLTRDPFQAPVAHTGHQLPERKSARRRQR